ncbi:MAG: radical SAM protein, partial [Clostridia bacterium]|nr:radical SAM protein [Clostridia bacterium]
MKISVFTLGCKVNESESASIRQGLMDLGFSVAEGLIFADAYVLNTCAVTAEAEKKSRQAVARIKKINPNAKILVTGCASQKDANAFLEKEGVVYVCGTQRKDAIISAVKGLTEERILPRVEVQEESAFCDLPISRATRTRVDIKVQDGCNNFCAYCLIPYLRGRERSRSMESVKREVLTLNAPEAVITGINVSAYQTQQGGLTELLQALKDVPSRIRLGSLEVRVITPAFLQAAKELKNFAPHFHL